MNILITVLHIIVCFVLIIVVLLQVGRGASMGAAFGGSSQTIFGSSGPGTFLGKLTTIIALIFMLTSLGLSYYSGLKGTATLKGTTKTTAPVPVAPSAPPETAPGIPPKTTK
ncbi:MAG: preprotein translocase subunit SecG [Syntrophales bacterium]|nr:preprotein translocase subunit SecG [Syntrophales bacterium]